MFLPRPFLTCTSSLHGEGLGSISSRLVSPWGGGGGNKQPDSRNGWKSWKSKNQVKDRCVATIAGSQNGWKSSLRSAVSTRNTSNSQLLDIPLFRTASAQRTFQYRATSLWNELLPALKLSPSVTAFKRLLRQKLLYDCFI